MVFHLTNDKWLLVLGKSTRLFPYISVAHMDSLQLLEKKTKANSVHENTVDQITFHGRFFGVSVIN